MLCKYMGFVRMFYRRSDEKEGEFNKFDINRDNFLQ